MFMCKKEKDNFIRTTVWLPRSLHTEAKIMAILTNVSLSALIRYALIEKIKKIKEKK